MNSQTKTIVKTKRFCGLCWRNGEIDNGDIETAKLDHSIGVRADIAALRVPAGMDWTKANKKFMLQFPGVDCDGAIHVGVRQAKPRFEKPEEAAFDFGRNGIEQS